MSLNWLWSEKCGEVVKNINTIKKDGKWIKEDVVFNLYQGNAVLIFIYEFTDDNGIAKYDVHNWWSDETHMKRRLGIDKKYKETYGDNAEKDCIKFTFYKDMFDKPRLKKIVSAITEAFDEIEIVITNSTDKGGK